MPKQVILVRHAQSLGNAGMRTTNPTGNILTEYGRQQAEDFAATIKEAPDLISWSSYTRTMETAAPLARRFPEAKTEEWPDIQEFTYLDPVRCFNTTPEERKPWVDSYWDELNPHYTDGNGAESFADMIDRARKLLSHVRERSENSIFIFTHGQFMEAIKILLEFPDADYAKLMRIFNEHDRGKKVANCEILRII